MARINLVNLMQKLMSVSYWDTHLLARHIEIIIRGPSFFRNPFMLLLMWHLPKWLWKVLLMMLQEYTLRILSRMVNNKKLLWKTRTTRIRNLRKTFMRMKNKEPHHCLLMIGSPWETTLYKIFSATTERQ